MDKVVINVEGMSCVHCKSNVTDAIYELNGIHDVRMSEGNSVIVEYDSSIVANEDIKKAIKEKGYGVIEEKSIYKG